MRERKILLILLIFLFVVLTGCMKQPNQGNPNNNDPSDNTNNPGNNEIPSEIIKNRNIENFVSEENEVPKIVINTEGSIFPINQEDYVKGTLKIVEQPNNEKIIFQEASMGIRLRGNTTLECPKKAFRVKFDEKQSLFGLPEAKNWVLLANYFDKTLVRNYLAYLTANKLDNFGFQPASIFVEVVFNGEYQGLYLLCEQMQTGTGRVDIEQDVYDESNPSYFFELDFIERILADGLVENKSYFKSHDLYFAIKYPDEKEITTEQCMYLKNFMDKTFDKILTGHNYDRYIDIDSFVNFYIISELFKNLDSFKSSVYFYLKNGKLYTGPVWDFDLSLGVVGKSDVNNSYQIYQDTRMWLRQYSPYYKVLFNDDEFLLIVKEKYQAVRKTLNEIYSELDIALEILDEEIKRDISKWGIPGDLNLYIATLYSNDYRYLNTYEEHINYLKAQLEKQFAIMDEEYLN